MININVYTPIGDNEDNVWARMFGMEDVVFSADTVRNILNSNPDEKDFTLNLDCKGGSVSEGLKIYDLLRTSGKNIFTNIEGGCHSMSVIILLAAAAENRTANRNARSLIHQVYASPEGSMNLDDVNQLKSQIELEQNNILDIYAERTGTDRTVLENLMKEEKQRTADELKQYGFISKINIYTNNQNSETMSKPTKEALKTRINNFFKEVTNLLNEEPETVNYDFKNADGTILFSTAKADDSLVVGDAASPDGTFEMPDGRKVTILDGAISNIADPAQAEELVDATEHANVVAENEALKEQLSNASTLIKDLQNELGSSYVAPTRNKLPGGIRKPVNSAEASVSELKNEAKAKRDAFKGRTK